MYPPKADNAKQEDLFMIYDKRRFPRIDVDFEVELFSQTRVPVGKGKAIDISTSGIGVKSNLGFQFKKGT